MQASPPSTPNSRFFPYQISKKRSQAFSKAEDHDHIVSLPYSHQPHRAAGLLLNFLRGAGVKVAKRGRRKFFGLQRS